MYWVTSLPPPRCKGMQAGRLPVKRSKHVCILKSSPALPPCHGGERPRPLCGGASQLHPFIKRIGFLIWSPRGAPFSKRQLDSCVGKSGCLLGGEKTPLGQAWAGRLTVSRDVPVCSRLLSFGPPPQACRKIWLGSFDSRSSLLPDSQDPQKVKEFLQEKYEKKRW